MDNNHALSAMELVLRSELNCNASIEYDSYFWFELLSFSEVIDKVSQSATQLLSKIKRRNELNSFLHLRSTLPFHSSSNCLTLEVKAYLSSNATPHNPLYN